MQVAEGIFQIQLPLPFPLRIVNCYLLRDAGGWTLVDAGLHYPEARAAFVTACAAIGIRPQSITRIVLTHAHPDHYGMAGWLAAQSGAPVLLSPIEQAFAAVVWREGEPYYRAVAAFFCDHGMPPALADAVYAHMAALRPMTQPAAETINLESGAQLQIGARGFQTIATPGHSDGHLVLYCAEERLLLCGDAVLNKITPNVSLWPRGRSNPLADFLKSLQTLQGLAVDLALPGHGPLIEAFSARLVELESHHHQRLQVVERAALGGATAFAVCQSVFPTDALSPHQLRFAMAETLAHLEYLVAEGRVVRAHGRPTVYHTV